MTNCSDSDIRVPQNISFTHNRAENRWDCNEMPGVWCTVEPHSREEPYEEIVTLNWREKTFCFWVISETRKIKEDPDGHLMINGKIRKPDKYWPGGYWEKEVAWHLFLPSRLHESGCVGEELQALEIVKKFLWQCPVDHPDIPFTVIDVTASKTLSEAMDRRVFCADVANPLKNCLFCKEDLVAMSITMEEGFKCWTSKRISTLIVEIMQGKTTVAEAAKTFDLTPSEIESWVDEATRELRTRKKP